MEKDKKKIENLQQKSHETLLKLLNNIGTVGAILAAIADIIFVFIFVFGLKMEQSLSSTIIFAIVNSLIGLLISILLRYQGQKYAEIENEDLITSFYKKTIKEKKHMTLSQYNIISAIKDLFFKGLTTCFGIFGIIYISIEGSKNPIQILLTLVTLVLFACFGLIGMNSSYCRYYKIQVPLMEDKIKGEKENVNN